MSKLSEIINAITEFGLHPALRVDDKHVVLKRLLVGIYTEYLHSEAEYDEKEYDEPPRYDYQDIRQNIVANFPDLGWYHTVLQGYEIIAEAEVVTGDAVDDLTDIVKDLLEVKWRMENTSMEDAMWYFSLLMKGHSEQHLVDLLKYLKDIEE